MMFEALLFVALALPHPRHRRVQAERLHASRLALRAGRHAARCAPIRSTMSASISARSWRRWSPARSAARSAGTTASRPPASACWSASRSTSPGCATCRRTSCATRAPTGAGGAVRRRSSGARSSGCSACSRSSTFFWATYDQQGNTLLLWVEDHTERRIDLGFWKGEIPTTWFLALNPLMIFVFTPILIRLWAWQARLGNEMSTIAKLSFGFVLRRRSPIS